MSNPFDYSGTSVFVAGGTSGINQRIAERFAMAGAAVCVISRNPEKVAATVELLRSHGGPALGFPADVRKFDEVAGAIAKAAEAHGPIDALVSGAAGNFLAPAAGLSSNGFRTVVDIDLNGTFNVMRAAYPHLRKPGAALINITAAQSWKAMPLQIHACAAKAGVDQVTRVLAVEWGYEGIRINSIAPGPIAGTEGMERLAPSPEATRRATQAVPMQRFGTKDEIADAALFLCSPMAAYITGTVLSVDGGSGLVGSTRSMADLAQNAGVG